MINANMKKFLFFDYWTLDHLNGFVRVTCRPEKYQGNPVFVPNEKPYEFNTCGYSTILYRPDEKLYQMWYGTSNYYDNTIRAIKYLCYAVSEDGVNWQRPLLDVVAGTNIVMDTPENAMGSSIIYDIYDRQEPYKLVMRPKYTPAVVAYTSKDGIHWNKVSDKPVIEANSDSQIGLYQDPATGYYFATCRLRKGHRKLYMSSSSDFRQWSKPVLVLEPDIAEGTQMQIYGMQVASYGNYVLGAADMYHTVEQDMNWGKMQGSLEIELAFSKGAYNWRWMEPGSRLITTGKTGDWDGGMVLPTTAPVFLKDEIRFYYAGDATRHEEARVNYQPPQGIGMATLRPDGFVALESANEPASLLTRQFGVRREGLYINADCRRGSIKAEICDGPTGKPLVGYSFADCVPVESDGIAQPVLWKECPNREKMTGRAIRIRLECRNSRLYSVFLPNGDDPDRYWEFDEIGCVDPLLDLGSADYYMPV